MIWLGPLFARQVLTVAVSLIAVIAGGGSCVV